MIRVISLLDTQPEWLGTDPDQSSVELPICSSVRDRIPGNSDGDKVTIFVRQATHTRPIQSSSRIRLVIGPHSLAREIDDMNRFLIAKGIGVDCVRQVKSGTLEKYATAMKLYAKWLEEHWYPTCPTNDYLDFSSPHPIGRPTYAYRSYLLARSDISSCTKNNHMSAVKMFYEHLEYRGVISGIDTERYQTFHNVFLRSSTKRGVALKKNVRVSDLHIPHGKKDALPTLKNTVIDDGIVRPLASSEIDIVLAVLRQLDNPIQRLTSYLALNTGARLQTVLTLRRCHARKMLAGCLERTSSIPIRVGGTQLAQTKADREYEVQVPTQPETMLIPCQDSLGRCRSIGELLGEYEASEFAQARFKLAAENRSKYSAELGDEDNEYLFIGRNGMPYYLHSEDGLNIARKSLRRGDVFKQEFGLRVDSKVRTAAREVGCSDLAAAGIGFHDFRGTFAEQSLLRTIASCQTKGMSRFQAEEVALRQTQRLLGHSWIESTYRYLHFRDEHKRLLDANEHYAQSLNVAG